jgi:hypothetical protein
LGLFYPGLTHFDGLFGLRPLPWRPVFLTLGILLAVPGFYFMVITNKLLRSLGSGANAFRLTKKIVAEDIYKRTRNPMSLGFYLLTLAMGFVSGSTLVTLVVLLGLIPAHIFFLRYFEELELELRFGESTWNTKRGSVRHTQIIRLRTLSLRQNPIYRGDSCPKNPLLYMEGVSRSFADRLSRGRVRNERRHT